MPLIKEIAGPLQICSTTSALQVMATFTARRIPEAKGEFVMKMLAWTTANAAEIFKSVGLVALISIMLPAAGHCDPVVNGNFSGGTAGFTFTGNVGVFNSASYDTCCASGDTGTGNFAAFGGGDGPDDGVISQTIVTVPGQEYLLTFQYGAFSSPADRGTQSLLIMAGDLDTTLTSGMSERDLSLVLSGYQYEFLASGASTTLTFADASTSTDSIDGFLDTVSVQNAPATPEPSSLLLLGTGILGMSGFCRARMGRSHSA